MTVPIRVGVLHDMADSVEEGAALGGHTETFMRLPIDDLVESGRLDREVEFVHAAGLGLPVGTAFAIERAFGELVDQGVLLIAGPAVGDNALVATPLADEARVPTINWAGTERARSEFMFHLQVGSHEDEPVLLRGTCSRSACSGSASCSIDRRSAAGTRRSSSPSARRSASTSPHGSRSVRWPTMRRTKWRRCVPLVPTSSCTWDSDSWAPPSLGRAPRLGGTCRRR